MPAAATVRLAVRLARAAGLRVVISDHVPAVSVAVYVPVDQFGPGTPPDPFIAVSSELDPEAQQAAIRAMADVHLAYVPLAVLVRASIRGQTCQDVAAALGVSVAAVEHRIKNLDPQERRLVRIDLAATG
jgi:hypothetical protein